MLIVENLENMKNVKKLNPITAYLEIKPLSILMYFIGNHFIRCLYAFFSHHYRGKHLPMTLNILSHEYNIIYLTFPVVECLSYS